MTHTLKMHTKRQKLGFTILINMLIPLAGVSTDIYLPSLPALSAHFEVSRALAQLTVTAFVVGMGLSQLIAGPVSDAYGRKKLLIAALSTQAISLIAILLSPSIYWMITWRFIQGLGAAFMIVPARAIINDVFEGVELKRQFNYTTICFALGPIVGPFLGGYLQHYFGWQSNFIAILAYAILLLLISLTLYSETLIQKRDFSIHHLWQNYHTILSNRYFLVSALFVSLCWADVALFNLTSPFLIQTTLQKSAIVYGRVALFMGVAWFLGNSLNQVLFHTDNRLKTMVSMWLMMMTSIIMLVFTQMGYFSVMTLAIPTFILILLSGVIFPIYIGECMVIFKTLAASANACLFGMIWLMFGVFTVIATTLNIDGLGALAGAYLGVSAVCLLFFIGLMTKLKPLSSTC